MTSEESPEYIIAPPRRLSLHLAELWEHRELIYFFTWRDIKVKYKQTFLGVFWAILQPVFMMLIFTFFFGRALQVTVPGMSYPAFVLSGLVLWNLFSGGITNAGNSMVNNANIIKKIYFPRLIIPISSTLSAAVDFLFASLVLTAVLLIYHQSVAWSILLAWPAAVFLTLTGILGLGCWLGALNIKYRDFRYVIPFLVQAMMFLTPVIYPISFIPYRWAEIAVAINPMFAAITLFRAPMTTELMDPTLMGISIGANFFLALFGLFYFKKTETYFADLA
jgi:lipopolysaccharide transport system permease protein